MLRFLLLSATMLALAATAAAQPANVLHEARQHLLEENYQKAAALLEASSALSPEGQYLLGRTYQARLRHEQAAEAFAKAIRADRIALGIEPDKTSALFHLATVYDAYYADPSAAREYYERFLDRTAEDELPEMRAHASSRLADLRERAFFSEPQRDTGDTLKNR